MIHKPGLEGRFPRPPSQSQSLGTGRTSRRWGADASVAWVQAAHTAGHLQPMLFAGTPPAIDTLMENLESLLLLTLFPRQGWKCAAEFGRTSMVLISFRDWWKEGWKEGDHPRDTIISPA